jgi:hypothetical protein
MTRAIAARAIAIAVYTATGLYAASLWVIG